MVVVQLGKFRTASSVDMCSIIMVLLLLADHALMANASLPATWQPCVHCSRNRTNINLVTYLMWPKRTRVGTWKTGIHSMWASITDESRIITPNTRMSRSRLEAIPLSLFSFKVLRLSMSVTAYSITWQVLLSRETFIIVQFNFSILDETSAAKYAFMSQFKRFEACMWSACYMISSSCREMPHVHAL